MLPENMALGSNVAKSTNSPEMIFSLTRGGTGGSETSKRVPICRTWPTLVLVVAGSVIADDVASGTFAGGSVYCCSIDASDKASLVSSACCVELLAIGVTGVESVLRGSEALACIVFVNCSSTFDNWHNTS